MIKQYRIEYKEQFEIDVQRHKKSGQKIIVRKIDRFLDELKTHPTTGTGKPEPLTGDRNGQWSRRISDKHRLVYEIHENIVTVIALSAWGHYGDK